MKMVLLILIPVFFYSCSTTSINISNDEFIPISVKNKWIYKYDHELNPKNLSFQINEVKSSNGSKQVTFDNFPCLGLYDSKAIIIKNTDGSYKLDYPEAVDFIFIPPQDKIETGYRWTSGEWNCSILGINESLVIDGKTYTDCLHITFSSSITFWGEMWIKKGVGIVKWAFNRTNPPTTELGHWELTDYLVN